MWRKFIFTKKKINGQCIQSKQKRREKCNVTNYMSQKIYCGPIKTTLIKQRFFNTLIPNFK